MKTENKTQTINIPEKTVTEIVQDLASLYTNALKQQIPFHALPTPFLWSPPGIGKSDGIQQLADMLQQTTNKTVTVTDIRLLLFSPTDLRGVPVADKSRSFTNWLKPKIFDLDDSPDTINIIFLDELSACPQSVQAAAYQICLDRQAGEHTLPANTIVIAAGNRTTDHSVSYKMPAALANRLMHFNIISDWFSWKTWALQNSIDSRIIGYLSFDPSHLCVEPTSGILAYPTPRAWTFVSRILTTMQLPLQELFPFVSACVGSDTAMEFISWCDIYNSLPSVDEILSGRCKQYPKKNDALYALISGLITTLYESRKDITMTQLDAVCTYAAHFPADYATMFYQSLNEFEELRLKLMKCTPANEWLRAHT